jgi:hypothetical protein
MALFEVLPQNLCVDHDENRGRDSILLCNTGLSLECCCKAYGDPVHVTASSFQMEMSQHIEKFTGKMEAVAMQENGSGAQGIDRW